MIIGKLLLIAVISYLLGSIPFGVIVGKLLGRVDIRRYGSRRTGATNVMRTVGKKAGISVIILDAAKAAGAVFLAKEIFGDSMVTVIYGFPVHYQLAQVVAGLAAIAGHNWPVFLKFRGGRGVSAFFGSWLALFPVTALLGALVLAFVALRTRYMSLGSIISVLAAWTLLVPLTLRYELAPIYLTYGLAAAALVIYQHRDNISRLRSGTERRLGEPAEELSF